MNKHIPQDEFSPLEGARKRRNIILAGIFRLAGTVLLMIFLAGVGFLVWLEVMFFVRLHALK
jgi:hypothetical protein